MQFIEIGALLQARRKEIGLSLEEIATKIKIPPKILLAVETANRDVLPYETFIRSYIKSYAVALDFTHDEIIELCDNIDDFSETSNAHSTTTDLSNHNQLNQQMKKLYQHLQIVHENLKIVFL